MKFIIFCAFVTLCFCSVFRTVSGNPVVENQEHVENLVLPTEFTSAEETLFKKLRLKCTSNDVTACLTLKGITYLNKLMKKAQIHVGDVVEITKIDTDVPEGEIRAFNEHGSEDEQGLQLFMDKAWKFVQSRSLKWKILDDTELVFSGRSNPEGAVNFGISVRPVKIEAGEARKKDKSGMGALIAAAALKIGLLKALAFKALALLVGKALLVSKLALVLALVIGLKKLFSQEKHVTYEVVAHPHHETHHEHSVSNIGGGHESYGGGGGWGRNFEAAKIAYKAYDPTKVH
nr:uncharacterized protein LOC111427107 [Onthophagus taurus]